MRLQQWYLVSYIYHCNSGKFNEDIYLTASEALSRKVVELWREKIWHIENTPPIDDSPWEETDVTILNIIPLEMEPVPDDGKEGANAKHLTTEGEQQEDTVNRLTV